MLGMCPGVDYPRHTAPIFCVEALYVGGERANIALLQASNAVVRKLMFMKGNRLRALGRDRDRKHKVGKWRP